MNAQQIVNTLNNAGVAGRIYQNDDGWFLSPFGQKSPRFLGANATEAIQQIREIGEEADYQRYLQELATKYNTTTEVIEKAQAAFGGSDDELFAEIAWAMWGAAGGSVSLQDCIEYVAQKATKPTINDELEQVGLGNYDAAWEIAQRDPGLLPGVTREQWLEFAKQAIQERNRLEKLHETQRVSEGR